MDTPREQGLPRLPSDEEFIAIFAEGIRTCPEDQRRYLPGSIGAALAVVGGDYDEVVTAALDMLTDEEIKRLGVSREGCNALLRIGHPSP